MVFSVQRVLRLQPHQKIKKDRVKLKHHFRRSRVLSPDNTTQTLDYQKINNSSFIIPNYDMMISCGNPPKNPTFPKVENYRKIN
jgi:hypothetical protein